MPAPELLIPIEANLLADPDDLTTASWTNSTGCSDAASTEYFGTHRFTRVSRTDATAYRYIHQSADQKYNDGLVAQAVIRKGVVSGDSTLFIIYEDLATVRAYARITWSSKTVALIAGTTVWSRWLDDSTVWVAVMTTGSAANKLLIYPSELTGRAAGDYVQVTMVMLEHATVPSYLPRELAARTALTGEVWWKVEVDPDGLGYDDLTAYLDNNRVRVYGSGSRFKEAISGGADFSLRNVPKQWTEGDFADCEVKISAKIGSAAYIQIFQGFVDPKGVRRDRGSITEDTVAVTCKDRSATRGAGRKAEVQTLYTGLKICDVVTPANSIAHKLAAKLGLATGDCDFVTINQTKDYGFVDRKSSYWRELQDLALQHGALLGGRYDGKLRLISWTEAEWNTPTPEYVFDDSNVHTPISSPGTEIVCNRVRTEFETYEVLAAGVIYKNFEAFDALTKTISIAVGSGAYWPVAADENALARLGYERDGEKFPIGVSIQTPTIGATGSGSDIEYTGPGTLILESFNGVAGADASKTQQHADASEIILLASGGAVTITKLTLRGTPIRVLSKNDVEDKTASLDEWDYREKTLPGKWATSATQAKESCERLRKYGEVARKRYENVPVDFTPHLQPGAIVTFNPTDDISMTAVIESYSHQSEGSHAKTITLVTLVEHAAFVTTGGGSQQAVVIPAPAQASQAAGTAADIADRPTYDEAIDTGWDASAGQGTIGTTTPTVPVVTAYGLYKAILVVWDRQADLTNFGRYELQVSPNAGTNQYALDFTGSGIGAENGDTDWPIERLHHTRIPFGGTEAAPTGTTYHYRARRVTKAAVASAWSAWASSTTLAIDTGDLIEHSMTIDKLEVGVLNALVAEIQSYLLISDALGWVAGNYAVPGNTDQRAYLDKNEIRMQYHNGAAWLDRFVVAATDATDNYALTLTSCPLLLDTIKARTASGLVIYEDSGTYGIAVADDGSVLLAPGAANYTLALGRVSGKPTIKGKGGGAAIPVIIDSYDASDNVYLQYYNAGDVVLAFGGGHVGIQTADIEAWHTNYTALEFSGSAVMGRSSSLPGPDLYLISNGYFADAWRSKTADHVGVFAVNGSTRTFIWQTATASVIDTAITLVAEMKLIGDSGTTTFLYLGGGAEAPDRDLYIYLASDTYIAWAEANSRIVFQVAGTVFMQMDSATIRLPVIPTSASAGNVFQDTADYYRFKRSTSSLRYKTDIRSATQYADLVLSLVPIVFKSLCGTDDRTTDYFGFGAEDVDALGYPGLVHYVGVEGKAVPDGVQYQAIIPLLVAKAQDHEARIRALEAT